MTPKTNLKDYKCLTIDLFFEEHRNGPQNAGVCHIFDQNYYLGVFLYLIYG